MFAAVPVLAQPARGQQRPVAQDAEDAKARLSAASKELSAFVVPMPVEPAFQFKAY